MADRQTDKATHWAVTAYGDDILTIENVATCPPFVKTVFGGREICPTTGREHFQGHIQCKTQQRFAAIKKWLPRAHIEIVRNVKASIQYALKEDTSSGEKKEMVNPKPFVTDRMVMEKLANTCLQFCDCKAFIPKEGWTPAHLDDKEDFWHRVRRILLDEPDLCGLLAKPDIYRLWNHTKFVWFCRRRAMDSITHSPQNLIITPDNINEGQVSQQVCEEDRQEDAQGRGEEDLWRWRQVPPEGEGWAKFSSRQEGPKEGTD